MINTSIILFALAAVLGITILVNWLKKKDAPRWVIYSHGILAAVALVLLIVYAVYYPHAFPRVSLILFVIAALIGFYMFIRDLMKKFSPLSVAIIHALVAVAGFIGLLFFAFA